MIHYTTIQTDEDILQILALQQANLPKNISAETAKDQGFVTVQHNFDLLKAMNEAIPQVIAKNGDEVVGYAIVMLPNFAALIPVLQPMFDLFDTINYKEKPVTSCKYYVMGQICVKEGFRGAGVFDGLYQKHKAEFSKEFDVCITEVAVRNTRSMRAHERVGFQTIHTYQDETDWWNVVAWDF